MRACERDGARERACECADWPKVKSDIPPPGSQLPGLVLGLILTGARPRARDVAREGQDRKPAQG